MSVFEKAVFDDSSPDLAQIINHTDAGIWALDIPTETVTWSLGFYRCLGYEPHEIACSSFNFIENILYHEDKERFLDSVKTCNAFPVRPIQIRLLTKTGYQWFQSTVHKHAGTVVSGTLINIHSDRLPLLQASAANRAMAVTVRLAKLAGWGMNAFTKNLSLSKAALEILQLAHPEVTLNRFLSFIAPVYRDSVQAALDACVGTGHPFEIEVQIRTAGNQALWVKMKAIALLDDLGKCQSVQGIIQDIHLPKHREQELRTMLKTVSYQNSRLQNFTHIGAHNLRSYAGNLQSLIHLYESTEDEVERAEAFTQIKTIGNSLQATIDHLNEIAKIDFEAGKEKKLIGLDALFKNAVNALQSTVLATHANITSDFTGCPSVLYLPAYLESIFHNLLSNALKYRHPDRIPEIHCESKIADGHIYLTVEDNGLGIDLEKYGHKVFGMYQTFHSADHAQGIGLYITRNQVEAMGGSITIESIVNTGTKFIIRMA